MGERNKRTKLKKSMGPGSIWAVAVGSIIGWGCFIQGGLWTERAGGPLPLFLGFLAGGLLMIVVGYSYSYMIAWISVYCSFECNGTSGIGILYFSWSL